VDEDVEPNFEEPRLADFWRTAIICYSLAHDHVPLVTLEEWTSSPPLQDLEESVEGTITNIGVGLVVSDPEGRQYPPTFELSQQGQYGVQVGVSGRQEARMAEARDLMVEPGLEKWYIRCWHVG